MASVAPATTEQSSQQNDLIQSDNWPGEETKRLPDDHDEVRFFQDRLNTGARILGE